MNTPSTPQPATATATATAPAAARPAGRPAPAPRSRTVVAVDYCRNNKKKILFTVLVIVIAIWALRHDWSSPAPKASGNSGTIPPVATNVAPNSNSELEALLRQMAEQSAIIEEMKKEKEKEKAQVAPTPSPESQPSSTARIIRTEPIKGPNGSQGVRTYWRDGGFNIKIRVSNAFSNQEEVPRFVDAWEGKAKARLITAYKQGREQAAEAEVNRIAQEVNAEADRRFSSNNPSRPRAEAGPILTFLK